MYVCGEGHIFRRPIILAEDYWDRGEVLYGCPICGEGYDEYSENDEDEEEEECLED